MSNRASLSAAGRTLLIVGIGAPAVQSAHAQIEFGPSIDSRTPTGGVSVAAGDINGDGRVDVVVAETFESVLTYENRGGGTFQRTWVHYEPNTRPGHLRIGDVNGDGLDDLVWVIAFPDPNNPEAWQYALKVLYNRGDGGAARVQTIALGGRAPGGVVVGDLLAGGGAEIVVVDDFHYENLSRARIYALRGQGVELVQTIDLPHNLSRAVVAGDFDGDGDLDLAVLNSMAYHHYRYGFKFYECEVIVLRNEKAQGFVVAQHVTLPFGGGSYDAYQPIELATGDLDGDGDLDLLASGGYGGDRPAVAVLIESLERGSEFRVRTRIEVGTRSTWPTRIAVADLNADGRLDISIRSGSAGWWVFENQGNFSFTSQHQGFASGQDSSMQLVDLTGDGFHDLIVATNQGWRYHENITAYDGPLLAHTDLKRGRPTTMTVTDARPGEQVHFLYSREGAGNSVGIRQLGGITLDLLDPIQVIGSAVANAEGVARLTITVPSNAPLTTVVMQAVIRRGPGGVDSVKTPFRTARVSE